MDLNRMLSTKQKTEIVHKKIRDLVKRGFSYDQIVRALNVSKTTIVFALYKAKKKKNAARPPSP